MRYDYIEVRGHKHATYAMSFANAVLLQNGMEQSLDNVAAVLEISRPGNSGGGDILSVTKGITKEAVEAMREILEAEGELPSQKEQQKERTGRMELEPSLV